MREKLNENSAVQIALVGLLALLAGYLLLTRLGGGEEAPESGAPTAATAATAPAAEAESAVPAESTAPSEAGGSPTSASAPTDRPLPDAVERAYAGGSTVVLLVVREGGIDDRLVRKATGVVDGDANVALFVVPASKIARYAPITGPLGVDRAPALIAIRPRGLNGGGPAPAAVTYGFQRAADVRQAVRDAIYRGPQLTYAPR